MNCSRVRFLLEEYFEGTLPEPQSEAVAKHVATCAGCAAALVQIERMVTALEAVPAAAPSDELVHAITARVAELPTSSARRLVWLRRWRWVAAAATTGMTAVGAVVAAAALLVWLGLGSHIPGAGLAAGASAFLRRWVDMVSLAMGALCGQGLEAAEGMGLALRAAAPTIGIYVAAEVGILLAVVLVSRLGKRRETVRPLLLV